MPDPIVSEVILERTESASTHALRPDPGVLAGAANEAAKGAAALWFFFLTFSVFLAVAVGSTTDRVLLLEQPIKLPIFGVDLPLVGFYWVAPALFVVLHFYVLVQIQILRSKITPFLDAAAQESKGDREATRLQARRLDPFILAQLLAARRTGERAWHLSLMAWITLVLGPLLLLLFFQVRFLPYHDVATSWVHRALIAVDLLIIVVFWALRAEPAARGMMRLAGVALASLGAGAVLIFSGLVATVPGEGAEAVAGWIDRRAALPIELRGVEPLSNRPPARLERWSDGRQVWLLPGPVAALRSVLFDGEVDLETRHLLSPFTRRLVLMNEELSALSDTKTAETRRSVSLAGRDLRFAVLTSSDLRKADLEWARLEGANLIEARLQGAILRDAELRGAHLHGAELQGASLFGARLQGAQLSLAKLQGADLGLALLQGADLRGAELQGADLRAAKLHGANLFRAELQGAGLGLAELHGANLREAQLHGAALHDARLEGASFRNANLWRTSGFQPRRTDLGGLNLTDFSGVSLVPFPEAERNRKRGEWTSTVPDGPVRLRALQRLSAFAEPGEDNQSGISQALGAAPDPAGYAAEVGEIACAADGAPHVARSIVRAGALALMGNYAPALARRLLDQDACRGTQGLDTATLAMLRELAAPTGAAPAGVGPM